MVWLIDGHNRRRFIEKAVQKLKLRFVFILTPIDIVEQDLDIELEQRTTVEGSRLSAVAALLGHCVNDTALPQSVFTLHYTVSGGYTKGPFIWISFLLWMAIIPTNMARVPCCPSPCLGGRCHSTVTRYSYRAIDRLPHPFGSRNPPELRFLLAVASWSIDQSILSGMGHGGESINLEFDWWR